MSILITILNEASYYIEVSIKEDSKVYSWKSRKEWHEQMVWPSEGAKMKSDSIYAIGFFLQTEFSTALFTERHNLCYTTHNPIVLFSLGFRKAPINNITNQWVRIVCLCDG